MRVIFTPFQVHITEVPEPAAVHVRRGTGAREGGHIKVGGWWSRATRVTEECGS